MVIGIHDSLDSYQFPRGYREQDLQNGIGTEPWSSISDERRGRRHSEICLAGDGPVQHHVEESVEDIDTVLIEPQPLPLDVVEDVVDTGVDRQSHDPLDAQFALAMHFDGEEDGLEK